jgi:hypothetical protein
MESNFNNREFEQYVKRNADQYRMIPSEKVWKGINNALHTRRRWYGLGLALLLLLTGGSVTWVMVSYPVSKKQNISLVKNDQPNVPIQPVNPNQAPSDLTSEHISGLLPFNKFNNQGNAPIQGDQIDVTVNQNAKFNAQSSLNTDNRINVSALPSEDLFPGIQAEKNESFNFNIATIDNVTGDDITVAEKALVNKPAEISEKKYTQNKEVYFYPLSIESVVNSYQPKKLNKKLTWQLYVAPTVSYRKLRENKSYQSSSPINTTSYPFASLSDVNKAVVHKPDMGLEFGASARYPLTKNLKLRGGLQFNINRYDIKAFVFNGEQATINLSGGTGNNSVSTWTYYRNYSGFKSDWLKNFYFTVSAPIGAELKLFGNTKTNFGIAGTVQPTYILSDRAYLISTDYKNYAEVPWLIRHVNVNTSFETFISYTSRRTKWQVGPQVRYQVLSSFQNKYPIKENLFDFGLKVGIILNE